MSELRVNNIVAAEGTSAPNLPYGIQVPTGMGITGAGGVNITGVATAGSFVGNITGNVTGNVTGNISGGTVAGSTGTFSSAVNVDATTDSTSSSTGALIVDGGLGVAKNVYIGAGLSIAGTLTYEDVTNVDSVGLITAKSGIVVPGGQLTVGASYRVGHAGVATAVGFVGPLTGAVTGNADTATTATNITVADESSDTSCFPLFATAASGNLPPKTGGNLTFNSSSGALTATSFVGPLTGDVTGNCSGSALNVTQAAQTNITSLGTLTGLLVSGDTTFYGANYNLTWDKSDNALEFADNVQLRMGASTDLKMYCDGTNVIMDLFQNGELQIINGSDTMAIFDPQTEVSLWYNNSKKFETTNDGVSIVGMTTVTTGAHFQGMLREDCNIVANKLSAGTNIDLEDGMVHYYSTNETTTATPNIRWNSSYSLNNKMSTGEVVTVTIIYKPNGAGYYASLNVDSSGVTEEWNGGSAPSSANSDGYDVLTHTLIKTGSGSFICLSNVSNFT